MPSLSYIMKGLGIMKRIISLLFVIVCMLSLCACSFSKDPISSEDFISYFEGKGYQVEDITSQFDSEMVDSDVIVMNTENDYQIEFYDLTSDVYAKNLFANNKNDINAEIQGNTLTNSAEIGNASKYSKNNDSVYGIISRIADTVIYSDGSVDNIEIVKTELKDLGY